MEEKKKKTTLIANAPHESLDEILPELSDDDLMTTRGGCAACGNPNHRPPLLPQQR